ncbi:hypothetical protein GCM10025859_08080 [Alicyclobacillus fastidiosus]|nr:hypothetical protein GCM10025859_08080 [Alicyclobacillus fastidiosus]
MNKVCVCFIENTGESEANIVGIDHEKFYSQKVRGMHLSLTLRLKIRFVKPLRMVCLSKC